MGSEGIYLAICRWCGTLTILFLLYMYQFWRFHWIWLLVLHPVKYFAFKTLSALNRDFDMNSLTNDFQSSSPLCQLITVVKIAIYFSELLPILFEDLLGLLPVFSRLERSSWALYGASFFETTMSTPNRAVTNLAMSMRLVSTDTYSMLHEKS